MEIRLIRADEWRQWREARLRMLVEQPSFFGIRYEDAVREPETDWQDWAAEAAGRDARGLRRDRRRAVARCGRACHLRIDRSGTQLYSMWVDPEARGRGVAQGLIQAVAAWAVERSCRDVYLFVQEANLPARAVYERVGFAHRHPPADRAQPARSSSSSPPPCASCCADVRD